MQVVAQGQWFVVLGFPEPDIVSLYLIAPGEFCFQEFIQLILNLFVSTVSCGKQFHSLTTRIVSCCPFFHTLKLGESSLFDCTQDQPWIQLTHEKWLAGWLAGVWNNVAAMIRCTIISRPQAGCVLGAKTQLLTCLVVNRPHVTVCILEKVSFWEGTGEDGHNLEGKRRISWTKMCLSDG